MRLNSDWRTFQRFELNRWLASLSGVQPINAPAAITSGLCWLATTAPKDFSSPAESGLDFPKEP